MAKPDPDPSDMRDEYDFSESADVIVGKYRDRYRRSFRMIRLPNELADRYPDEASVLAALHHDSSASAGGQADNNNSPEPPIHAF